MSHTPGPWSQSHREGPDGMWNTQVYDDSGATIATLAWYPVELPNGVTTTAREANARLIAAAPDLLVALKRFVNEVEMQGHVVVEVALAAIAKAEGR